MLNSTGVCYLELREKNFEKDAIEYFEESRTELAKIVEKLPEARNILLQSLNNLTVLY